MIWEFTGNNTREVEGTNFNTALKADVLECDIE
jgi:hypothetical protein